MIGIDSFGERTDRLPLCPEQWKRLSQRRRDDHREHFSTMVVGHDIKRTGFCWPCRVLLAGANWAPGATQGSRLDYGMCGPSTDGRTADRWHPTCHRIGQAQHESISRATAQTPPPYDLYTHARYGAHVTLTKDDGAVRPAREVSKGVTTKE